MPSVVFTSDHLILVVGAQKIVPALEDGFKRIREYCFPLEDKHMKSLGYAGSSVSKIVILEREVNPNRKIELIFVNEVLGY